MDEDTQYIERKGDVIINFDEVTNLVLNKMPGKRYFVEIHREIDDNNQPTGAYYKFSSDEDGEGIPDFIEGEPVPVAKEIKSYYPKLEKFMNENKDIQSLKLEIRVKD